MSAADLLPLPMLVASAANVRREEDDVADLVASIHAHGLLQPLVGVRRGDVVEIIDGGRRLRALQTLERRGERVGAVPVMLRAAEDDARAYELSLAANVVRRPLHPVQEYEAFAALADRGMTQEAIADHFGVAQRVVAQRLALGRLHPEARAAWREGRITGEAARALTLADAEAQARYLREATAGWQLAARQIRDALSQGAADADSPEALFVGVDAYLAAGGALVADLFAERPAFADRALLTQLANAKLAAEAGRIKQEEGWSAALYGRDLDQRHSMERLPKPAPPAGAPPSRLAEIDARISEINARLDDIDDVDADGLSAEERAALDDRREGLEQEHDALVDEAESLDEGDAADQDRAAWMTLAPETRAAAMVFLQIAMDGRLAVARGYVKPQAARGAAPPASSPQPAAAPSGTTPDSAPVAEPPAALSRALAQEMADVATRAAADVLAADPRLAKAALVATAATHVSPLRISHHGRRHGRESLLPPRDDDEEMTFAAALALARTLSDDDLDREVATIVARALDFGPQRAAHRAEAEKEATDALRAALDPSRHRAALVAAFDAAAYFEAAPRAEAMACIAECGDDPARARDLKKADLAARAARLAKSRAWLPAILRGDAFDAIAAIADAPETAADAAARIWSEEDDSDAPCDGTTTEDAA